MVWRDEHRDAFVSHMLKWDCPPIFSELYTQSRTSILLETLPRSHYACCWCHWYDSKTNVAQNAAGPSNSPLVWRNVPWLQKTYQMDQKAQPNLLLSCNNNTLLTASREKTNLEKRRQLRWLDLLMLAAQRCSSWWLRTNGLTFLLFLLSHGLSTFNHILCNHKWAFLTCYLDDPTFLHGISYSMNDQLRSGQVFPSDIAVPPDLGGRYRNMNTTFQRSNERAPVYELPPIHTLATTIKKNISNMSTQSSPKPFWSVL